MYVFLYLFDMYLLKLKSLLILYTLELITRSYVDRV